MLLLLAHLALASECDPEPFRFGAPTACRDCRTELQGSRHGGTPTIWVTHVMARVNQAAIPWRGTLVLANGVRLPLDLSLGERDPEIDLGTQVLGRGTPLRMQHSIRVTPEQVEALQHSRPARLEMTFGGNAVQLNLGGKAGDWWVEQASCLLRATGPSELDWPDWDRAWLQSGGRCLEVSISDRTVELPCTGPDADGAYTALRWTVDGSAIDALPRRGDPEPVPWLQSTPGRVLFREPGGAHRSGIELSATPSHCEEGVTREDPPEVRDCRDPDRHHDLPPDRGLPEDCDAWRLRNAWRLDQPGNYWFWAELAACHARSGDREAARRAWEKAKQVGHDGGDGEVDWTERIGWRDARRMVRRAFRRGSR